MEGGLGCLQGPESHETAPPLEGQPAQRPRAQTRLAAWVPITACVTLDCPLTSLCPFPCVSVAENSTYLVGLLGGLDELPFVKGLEQDLVQSLLVSVC